MGKGSQNEIHPFAPRAHQEAALERIAELRDDGEQRALVVLAPGLGKTAVAAHDVAQFEQEIERPATVLYVSHQSVILDQTRKTFEATLGARRRLGRFDGKTHDVDAEILFDGDDE
ncbi:MAG TPA: DEAD/DEAH box helicase family protein [Gaiellaceae bacterium]|jgi:superfamily II DNA or RNA helicase